MNMKNILFHLIAALIPSKKHRKCFRTRHIGKKNLMRLDKVCEMGEYSYISYGCNAVNKKSKILKKINKNKLYTV